MSAAPPQKYVIDISKPAEKALLKIPDKDEATIRKKIDALADNPRPHGFKTLKGADELYRIRAGNYRVIYQIIDRMLMVIVVRVADRKDAYWDT